MRQAGSLGETALTVLRHTTVAGLAQAPDLAGALGALGYGLPMPAAGPGWAPIGLKVMSGSGSLVEVWRGGAGALQSGTLGSVSWCHDGHWLFGALNLDERPDSGGLAALTERAYAELFEALAMTGFAHLQRLWNYLPAINAEQDGLERYRRFNSGRQQAFVQAGRSTLDGAPAACALGTHGGGLCLRFLAGRRPALAIENPRQVAAYRYPSDYGQCAPLFSRAALVEAGGGRVALLISGTSSIQGHASLHLGDIAAQTRETMTNLRAVLAAAHERTTARFELSDLCCTVYLRQPDDLAVVRGEFEAAVGGASEAARLAAYLEADICRGDLGVEIEAHVFAPGALLP